MGGHGGLNILPQKRWNVYNFDNREKVRKDEEAAAKEEQLKREQSRKRDAEFRLEKLRTAKGLEPLVKETVEESQSEAAPPATEAAVAVEEPRSDSNHINLFEGIKIFDIVEKEKKVELEDERSRKKRKKEEPVRVVTAEDEKYRLGYGVVGKGVQLPWYMSKPSDSEHGQDSRRHSDKSNKQKEKSKSGGNKKSLEELREERLAREKCEKGRERALLAQRSGRDRPVPEDRYYRR